MNLLNMALDKSINNLLAESVSGRPITKHEAVQLLSLPENSPEAALLRATANLVSRQRFQNNGMLLGQIGVDMAPCDGDCAFCFFAKSHTKVEPSVLSTEEVVRRCERFAKGGATGVFLMTMHRFGFEWFCNLCTVLRRIIPPQLEILANVGDLTLSQMKEIKNAGVSGAYHVCRLREGIDSCMQPSTRYKTIERILEAGLAWYNLCEPIGPEHTPMELADQIWIGVDLPCRQHGAMQRFPVPGSPLFNNGQVSLLRLGQIIAVITLATIGKAELKSIAVNVSNLTGLHSGANAFFPEAGEPDGEPSHQISHNDGFTTALWRHNTEISTRDCRDMMSAAGFTNLMNTNGIPVMPLNSFPSE